MCGIAGIINLHSGPPPEEGVLRRMLAMIRHRGPDQFGIYLDDQAGLGSARLSILDLGAGQQPLSNEDGTLWIVFNGEIFNHEELRDALKGRGHRFATRCDTEVVLHAYEDYGPGCLARFNGQFAVALWDTRRRELFLGRDRLGVRPLFYTRAGGALVFGSEMKAILCDPRIQPRIDLQSLNQAFTLWSPQAPRTIFEGILELPPGHYLRAHGGTLAITPYWTLDFPPEGEERRPGLGACVEEFQSLLQDATRIRLKADVPVGAYLSGGLDSSVIAALALSQCGDSLETFSIAFDDPEFDESSHQRRMAEFLGTGHHVVSAGHSDIARAFPEVVWHAEAPLLRTAPVPLFLLSRLVRDQGFKVVLTGEGADEFLGGYDLFKEARIRRLWSRLPDSTKRPALFRHIYPWIPGAGGPGAGCMEAFWAKGLAEIHDPGYSHAVRWRTTGRARRFLTGAALQEVLPPSYPEDFMSWAPLHRAEYLEAATFLSPYLLSSQGDRVAMAHSVEGRHPFLDHRLVEFCNQLPPALKLRGLTEKFLLKEASRPWLPDAIRSRVKRPYRAPIHKSFFHGRPLDFVEELLSPASLASTGLFNPGAVRHLKAKAEAGHALGETDDMALAGILSTQLLIRQFIERFPRPDPIGERDDVKIVALDPTGG